MKRYPHAITKQSGVVMITSLILLVVLTLIAVSMLKTSISELRIGGAYQIAAQNLANAESAIMNYVNSVNYNVAGVDWRGASAPAAAIDFGNGSEVQLSLQNRTCIDNAELGTGNKIGSGLASIHLDVGARATSVLGGETVVHQGLRATVVGNCG